LTHGRGADYVFEAAGKPVTMQNSLEAVRPGGMVVILGKVPFQEHVSFRFGSLFGEKVITRSSYGGARPLRDFAMLSQYYLNGQLQLDELLTRRITLDEVSSAFDGMARGEVLRAVVIFD
jgi:S-(hydroxymethyl)glutathione dehydrogenase/alcohol dehydrogenase